MFTEEFPNIYFVQYIINGRYVQMINMCASVGWGWGGGFRRGGWGWCVWIAQNLKIFCCTKSNLMFYHDMISWIHNVITHRPRGRFGSELITTMNQNRTVSDDNAPVPHQVCSILCVNMPKQGVVPCNMVICCPLRTDSIGLILDHLCVIEMQTVNGSTGAIEIYTGPVNNHDEWDLATGLSVSSCRPNNDSSNTIDYSTTDVRCPMADVTNHRRSAGSSWR